MNGKYLASTIMLTSLSWSTMANAKEHTAMVEIDIAGHRVPIKADGLYDRYRSNPPLSVIAESKPDLDLSWFKTLNKTKVDIGFTSYSPNFYYQNERITAVYTADFDKLKSLIPDKILERVQPLKVLPGRGLIVLTAYAYHYCDNDQYNEIALSVVTNKPGQSNWGPITLIGQPMSKDYWGYVLKLPVDTELARVRGVVGYNLPKWLTAIDFQNDNTKVTYTVSDNKGHPDLVFSGEKLTDLSKEKEIVTNSFTNLNQAGEITYGHSESRLMSYATSTDEQDVRLKLGNGRLSTFIKSLDLGAMVKYEYVPDFQSALYAPELLESLPSSY